MAGGPRYRVAFRRKREGKTDYRKHMKLLLSEKPRLVVRKTSNHVIAQLVEYSPAGDRVIVSCHSNELKKYGWKGSTSNIPSAYLVGLLVGLKAVKKGVKEAVLDIGLLAPTKKSKVFAVLKGSVNAGIQIPHDKEMLPDEGRIKGEHISKYAGLLREEKQKKFSKYLERGLELQDLSKHFDEVREKIMGAK
ncbi:MAG: 50S ribosomal protein L18 [Candidatus Hydrothermarchaeota archaeon]|nr:50S ribosomal protein L18 [Candidatus Hydrothermarchaeota archaeon]